MPPKLLYDERMSKRKINILLLILWGVPLIMFTSVLVSRVLFITFIAILAVLPLLIIIVCYSSLVKFVKKNSMITNSDEQNKRTKEKNRKLVQRLSLLIFCYFTCLLPLTIAFVYVSYNPNSDSSSKSF